MLNKLRAYLFNTRRTKEDIKLIKESMVMVMDKVEKLEKEIENLKHQIYITEKSTPERRITQGYSNSTRDNS